jgi:hypothetical protein
MKEGRKLLGEAVAVYRSVLEVTTKADLPAGLIHDPEQFGQGLSEDWSFDCLL